MAVTIQHHAAGITAYETSGMGRAMHALREGEHTWLIDPFHAAEFRDALSELPPLAGTIQLLDRHNRDCSEIAGSLDIPLHRVPRAVPGSGLEVIGVIDQRGLARGRPVGPRQPGAGHRRVGGDGAAVRARPARRDAPDDAAPAAPAGARRATAPSCCSSGTDRRSSRGRRPRSPGRWITPAATCRGWSPSCPASCAGADARWPGTRSSCRPAHTRCASPTPTASTPDGRDQAGPRALLPRGR